MIDASVNKRFFGATGVARCPERSIAGREVRFCPAKRRSDLGRGFDHQRPQLWHAVVGYPRGRT
jgi:hypothetical protein